MIKALLGITSWYHPRMLPNRIGHKFRARLHDQTVVDCETYRVDFGIRVFVRTVESQTAIDFANIEQWADI